MVVNGHKKLAPVLFNSDATNNHPNLISVLLPDRKIRSLFYDDSRPYSYSITPFRLGLVPAQLVYIFTMNFCKELTFNALNAFLTVPVHIKNFKKMQIIYKCSIIHFNFTELPAMM